MQLAAQPAARAAAAARQDEVVHSFTPYYNEDVTYTAADLNNKYQSGSADGGTRREAADEVAGGDEDNLHTLLKALFKDEWENFVERVEVDTATVRVGAFREGELGRWASDRGQLLSRTIRGVMLYADGLRVLGRLEGVDEEELEWLVSQKFEYVVTAQRYGAQKRGQQGATDLQKAAAIDQLRTEFAANLRIAYVDDPENDEESPPRHASVLLGCDEDGGDIVMYKVKLPGNPIIGEGKPENQNHAIIFAHGEYLQTLDMNQDNYLGESYKMRNLLELFKGDVRIVGFPEHIFSVSGGAVAHFSAVERGRLRHHRPALPDVAAHGALPLRPPRRVGQGVGHLVRRRRQGVAHAARVGGHLRRLQRHPARRHHRLHRVHPLRQGARHELHRGERLRDQDLGGRRDHHRLARLPAHDALVRHVPPPLLLLVVGRLLRDDAHVDVVGLPLRAHQRAPRHDEHGVVRAVRVRRRHGQRQEPDGVRPAHARARDGGAGRLRRRRAPRRARSLRRRRASSRSTGGRSSPS